MKICAHCKKPIENKNLKYCSYACKEEQRLNEISSRPKICLQCEKPFYKKFRRENWETFEGRKYCSVKCSDAGHKGPRDGKKICQYCNKQFKQRDTEEPRRFHVRIFCGHECHKGFNQERKRGRYSECPTCKKQFYKTGGKKYCCMKCYRKAPHAWGSRSFGDLPNLWAHHDFEEFL